MTTSTADDAVTLHYQPWLDGDGRTIELEALVRWHHQRRGSVSPEAFIPVFEESMLNLSLFRWALMQACSDAASWTEPLLVAIHLSPMQFTEHDLPELVSSVLAVTGLPAERLELAMTETALLADPNGTRATLAALDALGTRIALDDFGMGSLALSSPGDYPFSKLKIDPSFIASIDQSTSARWIIRTLIDLGHSQDLIVAAGGVETSGQRDFLVEQGCDLVQGLHFGRPGPIDSFAPITGHLPAPPIQHTATSPFAASRHFQETERRLGTA